MDRDPEAEGLVRARAVGLYWGLRSFAFFPAPLIAALLWARIGPDLTFLFGGAIGLAGVIWYATASGATAREERASA